LLTLMTSSLEAAAIEMQAIGIVVVLTIVGLRTERIHATTIEPTVLLGSYEPPPPSPPPGPSYRIASWQPHQQVGAKESIATPIEPLRIEPGRSVYRRLPEPIGAYRRDIYAWCNDAANLR